MPISVIYSFHEEEKGVVVLVTLEIMWVVENTWAWNFVQCGCLISFLFSDAGRHNTHLLTVELYCTTYIGYWQNSPALNGQTVL